MFTEKKNPSKADNKSIRDFIKLNSSTLDRQCAIYGGKEVFAALNTRLIEDYNLNLNIWEVAKEIRPDEVDPEIIDVIKKIYHNENLQ